jgi:hypothetical protein
MEKEKLKHPISRSWGYSDYRNFVIQLSESKSTSGVEQSIERIEATKLNAQRMKRIDKQIVIGKDLSDLIKRVNQKWNWLVIAESWCGDGAQNLPVISKMGSLNVNIDLKIILRDENPEIMDKNLTNGARSIPILICTDEISGDKIGIWGPRPKQIAEKVKEFKSANPNISHHEFVKNVHLWYAQDKGESIQNDFLKLIPAWENNSISG